MKTTQKMHKTGCTSEILIVYFCLRIKVSIFMLFFSITKQTARKIFSEDLYEKSIYGNSYKFLHF